jgi:hypothetical protein
MYVSIHKTKEKVTVSLFLSISHQQVSPCWPYESYSSPAKHSSIAGWPPKLCVVFWIYHILLEVTPLLQLFLQRKGLGYYGPQLCPFSLVSHSLTGWNANAMQLVTWPQCDTLLVCFECIREPAGFGRFWLLANMWSSPAGQDVGLDHRWARSSN